MIALNSGCQDQANLKIEFGTKRIQKSETEPNRFRNRSRNRTSSKKTKSEPSGLDKLKS